MNKIIQHVISDLKVPMYYNNIIYEFSQVIIFAEQTSQIFIINRLYT